MTSEKQNISLADARALMERAFERAGVSEANAMSVANALVMAEAEGQVGHGFSRLSDYIAQVGTGKVNGAAIPSVQITGAAAIVVDAHNGFAYPALDLAIETGVAMAQETGCAAMSITRSHHCGALSVQVDKIARQGLIGVMVANAPAAIAPWGSNVPLYGTNPIAFSAPRLDGSPLVIDLSLSRVARGKVMNAKKTGQPIPEGWALDQNGEPTTDPDAALAGSMVAIGEAKGTALALMVEILAAALTGAQFSSEMSSYFTADGPPPGSGQFLLAIKPGDAPGFAQRVEALLGQIAALEGARLPGARRNAALAHATAHGIDVPLAYIKTARELAGDP